MLLYYYNLFFAKLNKGFHSWPCVFVIELWFSNYIPQELEVGQKKNQYLTGY